MRPGWRFRPAPFEADALNPAIATAPWAGHRRFAYDYIRNILPRTVVELGTFHGCAFFAFCQAAKDDGLDWMHLYAVDNWVGNAHDTFYGEEVFDGFKAIATSCFGSLDITPIRRQFTDAAPAFAPASIDLLHMDGTHTYEALTEDYATWLPKLAPEGVIFLHDVHTERHGTTRLWRELTDQHPSLLFEHCFGLGLLFPKGDKLYRYLMRRDLPRFAPYYAYIGRLEMQVALEREARTGAGGEGFQAAVSDAPGRGATLEEQLRQAQAEMAREKERTNGWWQAAMDAQWKLDCLSNPTHPGE